MKDEGGRRKRKEEEEGGRRRKKEEGGEGHTGTFISNEGVTRITREAVGTTHGKKEKEEEESEEEGRRRKENGGRRRRKTYGHTYPQRGCNQEYKRGSWSGSGTWHRRQGILRWS
jgi:hypothetical protein